MNTILCQCKCKCNQGNSQLYYLLPYYNTTKLMAITLVDSPVSSLPTCMHHSTVQYSLSYQKDLLPELYTCFAVSQTFHHGCTHLGTVKVTLLLQNLVCYLKGLLVLSIVHSIYSSYICKDTRLYTWRGRLV